MAKRPFIIGIAGPSCSGKTTLAERLVEALGEGVASILPMDGYYRDLSHLDIAARAQWNFDSPEAFDKGLLVAHLRALAGSGSINRPMYDFSTHTRLPKTQTVVPRRVMIVEGLLALYWEDVRALLDLSVFVDAADSVCYARRLTRDVRERGRTEASVERQYAETVRPMYERYCAPTRQYAQMVLDGRKAVSDLVNAVMAEMKSFTVAQGQMPRIPPNPGPSAASARGLR